MIMIITVFLFVMAIMFFVVSLLVYLEGNKYHKNALICFVVSGLFIALGLTCIFEEQKENREGHTFIFHNNDFEHSPNCEKCRSQDGINKPNLF